MTKFDLARVREAALEPCERGLALLMTPDERQPVLAALEHAITKRFKGDRVVRLDVAELLADRVGPAKAATSHILLHGHGVGDLRFATPSDQHLAEWMRENTSITDKGADTIAIALLQGDFDAAMTLSARAFRDPNDALDVVHTRGQDPLREADARVVLDVMVQTRPDNPTWLLIDRLEELLLSDSPKCRGFRSGLQELVDTHLPRSPLAMIATCWVGASNEAHELDPALINSRVVLQSSEAGATGKTEVATFRRELERRLHIRLQKSRFEDVWMGLGDRGGLALIWPTRSEDPAKYAAEVAGDVAQILVGGPLVAVVPEWAMGALWEHARHALLRTFPALRFEAVSCIEMAHLCADVDAGDSEIAKAFVQRVSAPPRGAPPSEE